MYIEPQIDHTLAERNQQVAEAKAKAKANQRELTEVLGALKTDPRMTELPSQVGFQSEMGSSNRTEGGSGEGGDDDEGQ
ncbi:hypothetical protein Tco_0501114 [Tanacetum coccineum]